MWSVKFEVWSAKSAVCSVRCGVSREAHCRDRVSLNYRSFIFGKLPPPACPGLCYIKKKMAEDTRLKHSTESFNIENQSSNQSNQPQHPQQTMETEKLLKEISTNNKMEYTIMDTSQKIVLDYLLSSEQGEILKRDGQELKKLKIGEKTYNFERGKPISKRLITKFNKIRQTMDYKKYEPKEKRGIRWVNVDKNKALTEIQMRYKATTTNEHSAFKGYVNSYAIN